MANTIVWGIIFIVGITLFVIFLPSLLQFSTNGMNSTFNMSTYQLYQILPIAVIGVVFTLVIIFFIRMRGS
ncbi:MAG: hypothetical protein QXI16_00195 [Sulfolobaceae archaeon]